MKRARRNHVPVVEAAVAAAVVVEAIGTKL